MSGEFRANRFLMRWGDNSRPIVTDEPDFDQFIRELRAACEVCSEWLAKNHGHSLGLDDRQDTRNLEDPELCRGEPRCSSFVRMGRRRDRPQDRNRGRDRRQRDLCRIVVRSDLDRPSLSAAGERAWSKDQ